MSPRIFEYRVIKSRSTQEHKTLVQTPPELNYTDNNCYFVLFEDKEGDRVEIWSEAHYYQTIAERKLKFKTSLFFKRGTGGYVNGTFETYGNDEDVVKIMRARGRHCDEVYESIDIKSKLV